MWRCRVSYVTGASNWYWLTVGQGLLFLIAGKGTGGMFYVFCFFTFIPVPLSSLSLLSSPLLSLLSLFFLSLGTRADVLLNPNTINLKRIYFCHSGPKYFYPSLTHFNRGNPQKGNGHLIRVYTVCINYMYFYKYSNNKEKTKSDTLL